MTLASQPDRNGTLAVVAALPRELAPLAKTLGATTITDADGVLIQVASPPGQKGVLLVTAGMGPQRAALAVAAALSRGPLDMLLSVGLAGACDPALSPGVVVEASLIIDTLSGERFSPAMLYGVAAPGVLVTSGHIAGIAEKGRLHATYKAQVVDMEAATVARLARAHGIAFAGLKAVSDEHDVDVARLSAFSDARGHFRTRAFAVSTMLRPATWRSTLALGRNSALALEALTRAVSELMARRKSAQDH